MKGGMDFEVRFGKKKSPERDGEEPMRILLLSDFSGRRNRGVHESPAGRRPVKVDLDNFDPVLRKLGPGLDLGIGEIVSFASLDDFHPDSLHERLGLFRGLRALRARLSDPATFAAAAAELTGPASRPSEPAPAEPAAPAAAADTSLERLLGRPAQPGKPRSAAIDDMIRRSVAPFVVPRPDPRLDECLKTVDAATGDRMRAVLHHEAFRKLEAAWRGAWWLLSNVDLDEDLEVWLFDATGEELAADLAAAGGSIEESGLYRALLAEGEGGRTWSLIAGSMTFGGSREDVSLLASLGALASVAGGPFLGGAAPELAGCPSFLDRPDPADWRLAVPETFEKLRTSPLARWIGLAGPRILLRVPYGPGLDEIESFPFAEFDGPPERVKCLWGPAAFGAALLIGQAFRENPSSYEPGDVQELPDLPAVSYAGDDGPELIPSAEAFLSERAAQAMLDRGLIPIVSWRNRNAAKVVRFQSLASPPAALAGPWA
jgi:type VI secretion system protein ImpC